MKPSPGSKASFEAASTPGKYLARHAAADKWPLTASFDPAAVRAVVVIPALAESAHLFATLAALTSSGMNARTGTLVLCVVNNHAAGVSPAGDIDDNQATLQALYGHISRGSYAPMMLAVVDASSEGHTLPAGEGVGLARKIGLDHGLRILASTGRLSAPLVCLDADSPPAPGYLDAVIAFYETGTRWAGYTAYMHRFPEAPMEREAITAYEIYMRYHETGLHRAGSPYAYPALGSIISCTGTAYAACGGMNRRCAGEDFYFMQQLTKTGPMEPVPCALVYPSGRSSSRTPFGTGRSVIAYENQTALEVPLYHPACYALLREFFRVIPEHIGTSGTHLQDLSAALHPELGGFLLERGFVTVWQGLLQRYRNPAQRLRQFHVWFDGLRTIQLIHRLREKTFPDQPAYAVLPTLAGWLPEEQGFCAGMSGAMLLALLRQAGLQRHAPHTLPAPDYCPDVFLRLPAIS